MTLREAYSRVHRLPNRNVLIDCLDIGDRWAFMFSEKPLPPGDHIIGGAYDAVHKQTGKITTIPTNPANWDIFERGRRIDIRQF